MLHRVSQIVTLFHLKSRGYIGAMARQRFKTKYSGVRYRKHSSRKNGVKFDKYFFIRYQKKGKQVEEGVGWETEEFTETKVFLIR